MEDQQSIHLVDHTDADDSPTPQPELPPPTPDSHIDILYENQRGWFVFGIPLFSGKALWNFKVDPSPWVDAKFRPSAVNITNAQVPDPSWVWDWKSWYVDMSLDVDEEGWQYSFLFRGSPWHGNHPWFHSFVRRRRWLRKRIKQKIPPKTKEAIRERMFGDAFSVGTTLARANTPGAINTPGTASLVNSSSQTSINEEIRDTVILMRRLKKAAIDREKIVVINRFVDEGGEELYYLAEQVSALSSPRTASVLIFLDSHHHVHVRIPKLTPATSLHIDGHVRRCKRASCEAQGAGRARGRCREPQNQQPPQGCRGSRRRMQKARILE
jgi:hypothetical protein